MSPRSLAAGMTCPLSPTAAAAAAIPSPHSGSAPATATPTEAPSGHVATIETTQPLGVSGYIDGRARRVRHSNGVQRQRFLTLHQTLAKGR